MCLFIYLFIYLFIHLFIFIILGYSLLITITPFLVIKCALSLSQMLHVEDKDFVPIYISSFHHK